MHVEDVLCTSETMRQLTSLGQDEMPNSVGIAVFDYHPPTEDSEATPGGAQSREAAEGAEATSIARDPPVVPWIFAMVFLLYNYLQLYLYMPNLIEEKFSCSSIALLFLFLSLKNYDYNL